MNCLRASIVLLSLLVAPSVVVADGPPEWEVHLRAAAAAFDAGELSVALWHYAKARELDDRPELALQVAYIHERMGACDAAKAEYTQLLARSDVPADPRKLAASRLAGLSECGAPGPGEASNASATQVSASAPAVESKPRLPRGRKTAGHALVWGGALAVVGGMVVGTGWFLNDEDALKFQQGLAVGLMGTGAVAIVTGTTLLLTGKRIFVSVGPRMQAAIALQF